VLESGKFQRCHNEFMRYIGGQVQVQCSDHKLPLIVNNTYMEK
jgi:hypothetical protein